MTAVKTDMQQPQKRRRETDPSYNPPTGHPARDRTAKPAGRVKNTKRLDILQTTAAGQPLTPDPVHLTSTSFLHEGQIIRFTIQPTEEDLKQMQTGQDKNGRIKRPMNAFMVWSLIHRAAWHKACPKVSMADISIKLGWVWSKLSQEQKMPYNEMADKLKVIHRKQFPGYEYSPQKKKKGREYLTSGQKDGQDAGQGVGQPAGQGAGQIIRQGAGQVMGQRAGQGAGQQAGLGAGQVMRQGAGQQAGHDCGVSYFALQARPPAQLLDARMYPYPAMMPYYISQHDALGYYSYPFIFPHHPMDLYSQDLIHFSRFFHGFQNTSSSMWRMTNDYNLQREETTLAAHTSEFITWEHQPADRHHEVLISSATTLNLDQHDTVASQQLSGNIKMQWECEDDIDVVGLF